MVSSLVDQIDRHTVAAEIELTRASTREAILLVEGADDQKFFEHFVVSNVCEIVIGGGKEEAMAALAIVGRRGITGVVCIVDQDYDEFENFHPADANILSTDEHDIESMMFRSSAFDKVLRELGSAAKIKANRDAKVDMRERVREAAHPIGTLRLVSQRLGLNLKFKELRYVYVNTKLEQDIKVMIKEVHNHSRKLKYDEKAIIKAMGEESGAKHDRWLMCSGHDLCVMFGKALQSLFGTLNAKEATGKDIEGRLRLAYSAEDFMRTRLYAEIKNWEHTNRPLAVLRI